MDTATRYAIEDQCRAVMRGDAARVREHRAGKTMLVAFMAAVMKRARGTLNPALTQERLVLLLADHAEPRDPAEVIAMRWYENHANVAELIRSVAPPPPWDTLDELARATYVATVKQLLDRGAIVMPPGTGTYLVPI